MESSSKISKILHLTKASIGVFEYTKGNPTVFCSSNLFDILNLPKPPNSGEDYSLMDTDAFNKHLDEVFEKSCEGLEGIYALQQASGDPRYVQITMLNEGERVLGAVSDVTEDVLVKFRIEFERDYDVLTNLFNRRAFQMKALERLESQDVGVAALVMLDLDNLKYINDTYGHDYGDRYIVSLSECLQFFSGHNAITARRSGDEFYTLLYGYSSREEAQAVIEEGWRLIQEKSFYLPNGSDYRIRVSGGIAWYPEDATDLDMLIRYADFAMYNSKHTVKGSLLEFNREIYANSISVLYGQEALNQLLDNVGLKFALQPIITVSTGEVYGYELLMRPQSDSLKTPGDVLQIAQAQSKLHHIEHLSWMRGMETFCTLVEQEKIAPEKKVFINSIGSQCMSDEEVAQFVERFGPYLNRIVLEIMESDPGNTAYTNYKVQTIRNWGGMVAVDDYGTGYNSGASLIFLSPDIVKLDMSIVRDIDKNTNRQALLKDLLSYVKSQNVQVLAEGVETQGEMELLVAFGVEYIQGYYTGRPSYEPQPIPPNVVAAIRSAYQKRLSSPGQV